MNLYLDPKSAKEFSDSRYAPWQGWFELLKYFSINTQPLHPAKCGELPQGSNIQIPPPSASPLFQRGLVQQILDIGSGNGRFLKFLLDQNVEFESYTGIDYSDTLLDISKQKFDMQNVQFLKQDFTSENWEILQNKKFDIVVGFGVTHHLETEVARNNFFKNIKTHLARDGIVILSFWEFWKIPRLMKKTIEISPNLYKLTFGNDEAERVCYRWDSENIQKIFELNEFRIEKEFDADWNKYLVSKPSVPLFGTPSSKNPSD